MLCPKIQNLTGQAKLASRSFYNFFFLFLLSGCQLRYIASSAYHQADLLRRRIPLSRALAESPLSEYQREQLNLTVKVRKFMENDLGLNVNKNFATYVHLNRDYVTYVVSAAPKDKLESHSWSFPIVGSVPYKGYFVLEQAKDEEKRMMEKGFDTYLRGVSAYSTLGWFSDPLLSSMLQYDPHQLVDTLIHETIHANLYIKGVSRFNERVASFLAGVGTREFYKSQPEGEKVLNLLSELKEDRTTFSTFITAEINKLRKWYEKQSSTSETMALREDQFLSIKERFKKEVLPRMKTKNFDYFENITLNNARLLLYDLYVGDQKLFQRLVEKKGNDFQTLFKELKSLEGHSQPEIHLEKMLSH